MRLKLILVSLTLWFASLLKAGDSITFRNVIKGHLAQVETFAISDDGKTLVSGGWDNAVRIYQIDSMGNWEYVRDFKRHFGAITTLTVSPDNKYFVSGSKDNTFNLVELATGNIVFTGRDQNRSVTDVFFTNDGKYLFTSSEDGFVFIYKLDDMLFAVSKPIKVSIGRPVYDIALSMRKGKIFVCAKGNELLEINTKGKVVRQYAAHTAQVNSMDISPDKSMIATSGDDKRVFLWNSKTGDTIISLTGHDWKVNHVSFSPDGRFLLSSGNKGKVVVWSMDSMKMVHEFTPIGNNARKALFTSNMKELIVATLQKGPLYGLSVYNSAFAYLPKEEKVDKKNVKTSRTKKGK